MVNREQHGRPQSWQSVDGRLLHSPHVDVRSSAVAENPRDGLYYLETFLSTKSLYKLATCHGTNANTAVLFVFVHFHLVSYFDMTLTLNDLEQTFKSSQTLREFSCKCLYCNRVNSERRNVVTILDSMPCTSWSRPTFANVFGTRRWYDGEWMNEWGLMTKVTGHKGSTDHSQVPEIEIHKTHNR